MSPLTWHVRAARLGSSTCAVLTLLAFLDACHDKLPTEAARVSLAAAAGGGIYTTTKGGTVVNENLYAAATDVYLSGGPQNGKAAGPADGTYYFQVTDPSGKTLLSTDNAVCRRLQVTGGRVVGAVGPACKHANGAFNAASGATPVQLAPFAATPNPGSEYKVWMIRAADATISTADPKVLDFKNSSALTDNFKVREAPTPPAGSCQPSSSLSVLVSGTNVVSYVPKGNWIVTPTTGVGVVNVEGSSIIPTVIPTPAVVNSCASNALTGQTVCVANNNHVYLISGTTLGSTLTSAGSGLISFSGGWCTNCSVAMDATHNLAVVGLSLAGTPGFQVLRLGTTPTFEPAFASRAGMISEDPLIDPIRNLLLSAAENNKYEIVDLTTTTSPAFFVNSVASSSPFHIMDSSGEDCTTGIALAPFEFSRPSEIYVADLTQATFTSGSPGTWTAPSQIQVLSESFLNDGASGIAVAQGTHIGIVTGEFGGSAVTAIRLPATSGSGTPAIVDWVTCDIPGFTNGFDPHTVTAYRSPSSGNAIAVLANAGATQLAVVDLTKMLNTATVPRTGGAHGCAAGALPASVFSFVPVP